MIVIYCYLEKEKDILKFHVNKSADFGEEQHPSTKPSTIICFKCLKVESCDLLSKLTPSQML